MYILTFCRNGLCVLGGGIVINPLFYFDKTGAVVDFVSVVCSLCRDGMDLTDEGELMVTTLIFGWL